MLFNLARQAKIFVALEATDMRRGFDGPSGAVQQTTSYFFRGILVTFVCHYHASDARSP
jgi:hypothetical protein